MASVTLNQTTASKSVGMGQIVAAQSPARLSSVLGSCIGVALYHSRIKLGILAHVVLPDSNGKPGPPGKFADTAVPEMLKLLRTRGGTPAGAVVKVAGGACMFGNGGPMQIGDANAQNVLRMLQAAGVRVVGKDIGGKSGRRVSLDCTTGEFTVETVGKSSKVL